MIHRQICNTDVFADAFMKISDHMITCFYAGTPVECVVAPEDIFMNKMAHRPFRFLIVQQETVDLIKLRLC